PRSLILLQSKCWKRGGGAVLVDGSKHCWTFLWLATLTEEILFNILVFIPKMRKILKRLSTITPCNTKEKWCKLWGTVFWM
uniref:Uncharacterized protein n=1 Tax=Romanomermis culicivorax TaxID=13658 RepID=A0A915INH1_ROMCU